MGYLEPLAASVVRRRITSIAALSRDLGKSTATQATAMSDVSSRGGWEELDLPGGGGGMVEGEVRIAQSKTTILQWKGGS